MDNIKPLESSDLKDLVNKYSHFFVELRKRLMFTVIVFLISCLIGFIFYENIIKFLINLLNLRGINVVFTSPFQFINLAISCAVSTGIIVSFPLLVIQILSFLKPALRSKEYKLVTRFLPFSLILFIAGFAFGAFIMKWQIEIFTAKSVSLGIGNVLDISKTLTTILLTSALMGIGFQFPIILLLLMRIGIVKQNKLNSFRPWIYLGSLIFSILLPADSILADILLALPLIVLFEITLVINKILDIKNKPKSR